MENLTVTKREINRLMDVERPYYFSPGKENNYSVVINDRIFEVDRRTNRDCVFEIKNEVEETGFVANSKEEFIEAVYNLMNK